MTAHPAWCDRVRCVSGGRHESTPLQIPIHGKGDLGRLLVLLWSPLTVNRIRIRLVVVGELMVNSIDLPIDDAALTAASLTKLIALTRPPEHSGPVSPADPPE